MTTILRVLLGRLIGAAVAGLATFLMSKWGIMLDPDTQAQVTEQGVIFLMVIFTAIYSIVHKVVNKKLNPGDTASATLADRSVRERERIG